MQGYQKKMPPQKKKIQKRGSKVPPVPVSLTREALKKFANMTSEPEGGDLAAAPKNFKTFGTGCINAGDVFLLPPGFALVQKAVNTDTVGLRLNSHLLCHDAVEGPCVSMLI